MTKGGKRYANMDQDGKWSEETQEALVSTGSVPAQELHHPTLQTAERYPKIFINPKKKRIDRKYPFSEHDNRAIQQDNIDSYDTYALGRKKCVGERRQHNSHFCLCHDGSLSSVGQDTRGQSAYQSDFLPRPGAESLSGTCKRRYPRSHLERSHQAAVSQAEDCYMWFGRHDQDRHIPLDVLATANHSS